MASNGKTKGIASIVFEKNEEKEKKEGEEGGEGEEMDGKDSLKATRGRSNSEVIPSGQSLLSKGALGNGMGTGWTRPEAAPKCSHCNAPLSGVTVEAAGGLYHQNCFGCTQCGKKLDRVCVNVGNKVFLLLSFFLLPLGFALLSLDD